MTITNDKKTDTAIDNAEKSLKNFDGAVEHVRRTTTRNLIKVTSALDDITATLKSIKDSSEAVDYIDRVKPTRERLQRTKESLEKLLRSCKDYGNAVQTGDDNKADQAVDGMKDELKSLASISPEMAAELKALQAAYDELKTIVDRLVINDEKQDARLDHIEAYLEAATAGNGFTPYVRYGATPATPEQPTSVPTSTTPLPAASQDQPSITDVQSLADATDATYEVPVRKGLRATFRERFARGTGRQGQGFPRPAQYFGTMNNNPATAGGAH